MNDVVELNDILMLEEGELDYSYFDIDCIKIEINNQEIDLNEPYQIQANKTYIVRCYYEKDLTEFGMGEVFHISDIRA